MDIDKKALGQRIKSVRKAKGLTLEEFGKLFDSPASRGVVSNWESGNNVPNNERLKIIAELGEISVDELLYGNLESFVYGLYMDILDEKKDNDTPTLPASLLADMQALAPNKFKDTFKDALMMIGYLRLSYEDEEQISKILKDAILMFRYNEEFTNEGTINFVKSKIEFIYEYQLLNFFFSPKEGTEVDYMDKVDNLDYRTTVTPDLYFEICKILENTEEILEELKKKYPNI